MSFSLEGQNHGEAGPREGFIWAWELLGWSHRRSTEASPAFGSSCHHRKFTEQKTGRGQCYVLFQKRGVRLHGSASCASVVKTVFVQSYPTGRTWPRLVCAALTLTLTVEAPQRGLGHCQGSGDGIKPNEVPREGSLRPAPPYSSSVSNKRLPGAVSECFAARRGPATEAGRVPGAGAGPHLSPHSLGTRPVSPPACWGRGLWASSPGPTRGEAVRPDREVEFRWPQSQALGEACDGQEMFANPAAAPLGVQGPCGGRAFHRRRCRGSSPPLRSLAENPWFPRLPTVQR